MKFDSCFCRRNIALALALMVLLVACGGGGGGTSAVTEAPGPGGGGVVTDPGSGGVVADPGTGGGVVGPGTGGTNPGVSPPSVQSAPVIAQQPASQTVVEDASATFSIGLAQATGATYQWLRNGADIPGATQPSFTLSAAGWGDDGALWSVRVSNAAGSVVSSAAKLTLTERRVETPVGISVFSRAPVDERPIGVDSRGNVITVSLDMSHPVLRKYSPSGAPRPYGPYPEGIALAPPQRRVSADSGIVEYMMFAMDASDNVDVTYTEITSMSVGFGVLDSPTACAIYVISPAGETRLLYQATRAYSTLALRPFTRLVAAYSMAAGGQGLYLTDFVSRSIGKLAADGTLTQVSAPSSVDIPVFGFSGASQLAIDPSGTIYLNGTKTISEDRSARAGDSDCG